jgi:spoIIIJ-associated protein
MTDAETAERDDDLDEAGALEGAPDLAQEEATDLAQEEAQEAPDEAQDEALDEAQEAHGAPDDGLDEGLDEAQVTKSEDQEERLVAEGEIAGDYLEELLDLLDFDGDIDLDVEGNRAVVSIDGGTDLEKLVGRRGEVLDALQELTRLAVHQKTGERSRLMLDVAGWRRRRREELAGLGHKVAERVLESGEREQLAPMTPFERKIVHDAVAAVSGVRSESEGQEPARRVVVLLDR